MLILLVEDEPDMAQVLREGLEEEGHTVLCTTDGKAALYSATHQEFDAILLDVMIPEIDGFAVAQQLRQQGCGTPILMLTAKDSKGDVLSGLNAGADDYLVKPFDFDILLARLRAITRRGVESRMPAYQVADLILDPASRMAQRFGEEISLSRREYALLEMLMRRAGKVVTREAILDAVWGFEKEVTSNSIEAWIKLLRAKIEREGHPRLLHTVRGVGYILRAGEV